MKSNFAQSLVFNGVHYREVEQKMKPLTSHPKDPVPERINIMHRPLRAGILITVGVLIICMISGCGDDDPLEEVTEPTQPEEHVPPTATIEEGPPAPTITVMVDPPPGSNIDQARTEFRLRFSAEVSCVKINGRSARGSGFNWSVSANHLPLGPKQALDIEWKSRAGSTGFRSVVGPYTVEHAQDVAPAITRGTVFHAEPNVDPAPINARGFRFEFDEPVTGTVKLTDEAGVDLNWIANVVGWTATLTAAAGQELVHNTTYMIHIDVVDRSGNRLRTVITFVTQRK